MPSIRTRQAYDRLTLAGAQVALSVAASAVQSATNDLEAVQDTITDLTAGELDLTAITVGGVRFVQFGGELIEEP